MTGTRTARTQALALRIGELLDRGISAESIRAELIRKGMPAFTAAELVRRVIAAKERARFRSNPTTDFYPYAMSRSRTTLHDVLRAGRRMVARRHTGAGVVFACAALTLLGGFQLVRGADDHGTAELVARLTAEVESTQAEVFRLEAELVSRKEQAQALETLRARIGAGPVRFASREAYRTAVDRYQRQLRAWNTSLTHYQQVSRDYTALVTLLNARTDSLAALTRAGNASATTARN